MSLFRKSKKKWGLIVGIFLAIFSVSFIILLSNDYRDIFKYWNKFNSSNIERIKTATSIIENNRKYILNTSNQFKLSPVLFAGIIYTENCLNENPSNYFKEYYIKQYLLNEPEEKLKSLWKSSDSLNNIQSIDQKKVAFRLKNTMFWTVGICKVSVLTALNSESDYAKFCNRKPRSIKEVITALLIPNENLGYCAFQLIKINAFYKKFTSISINDRPEIILTAYNIGHLDRLEKEYRHHPQKSPKTNIFGDFFLKNVKSIKQLIRVTDT